MEFRKLQKELEIPVKNRYFCYFVTIETNGIIHENYKVSGTTVTVKSLIWTSV